MSGKDYEAQPIPLQRADQRDQDIFHYKPKPAQEQNVRERLDGMDFISSKGLPCLEYTSVCPNALDIISKKVDLILNSRGIKTIAPSKQFLALCIPRRNWLSINETRFSSFEAFEK